MNLEAHIISKRRMPSIIKCLTWQNVHMYSIYKSWNIVLFYSFYSTNTYCKRIPQYTVRLKNY